MPKPKPKPKSPLSEDEPSFTFVWDEVQSENAYPSVRHAGFVLAAVWLEADSVGKG